MERKLTKLNHMLIAILIVAQPFIIMFQAMVVRDIQVFGLSVFESFNIVLSVFCLILTIYLSSNKRKFLKYIPYVAVLGLYMLIHIYNTYQFNNSIYPAQTPSFLVETYYIGRTFMVPFFVLFSVYYSGMKKEQLIKILEILLFVVVFVMVSTNLFGIALRNYTEGNVISEVNLFDWFTFENTSKYSYYKITTKGWFLSGNQMSAVLFMTFLITTYRAYNKRDMFHYILMTLQMMAMFMLGTKVANGGSILLLAGFFVMWCVFALLKHQKKSIFVIVAITLIFTLLIPFSPVGYMYRYRIGNDRAESLGDGSLIDNAMSIDMDNTLDWDDKIYYLNLMMDSKTLYKLDSESLDEEEKEFVRTYMTKYYEYYGISPYIIENYDDLEHSEFWVRYLQKTPNNDYRVLKTMILEDIYEKNDNILDKYFGMGYTLNYIYTEADYSYQMYLYGIMGLLLFVGPYFYLLFVVVWKGLRNFKKLFNLECAVYFLAPLSGLCVAKMSGHVLERSFPLMMVSITIAIVLLHVRETLSEKKEIV